MGYTVRVVDLHAHSTASDGVLRPAELVALAHAEGLSAIALTDHDTVAGIDEARRAAKSRGITLVPGIELEVDWTPGVFHLLGLDLQRWSGHVRSRLEHSLTARKRRNLAMVKMMQQAGIPITYHELTELSGHDTVGRPHFAQLLLNKGVTSSLQEAYDRMIGDGRPFYERKESPSVGAACAAVHAAGGVAVIAHPQTLRLEWDDMERQLRRWKSEGLDGIEAYHARMDIAEAHRLAALADELGLIVTAGSDFHGPAAGDRRLGYGAGDAPIDDAVYDRIRERTHARR